MLQEKYCKAKYRKFPVLLYIYMYMNIYVYLHIYALQEYLLHGRQRQETCNTH